MDLKSPNSDPTTKLPSLQIDSQTDQPSSILDNQEQPLQQPIRVVVKGLGRYFKVNQFKEYLSNLGIEYTKLKTVTQESLVNITFANMEIAKKAYLKFKDNPFNGKNLSPDIKTLALGESHSDTKEVVKDPLDSVTSLRKKPYVDQLVEKAVTVLKKLDKLRKDLDFSVINYSKSLAANKDAIRDPSTNSIIDRLRDAKAGNYACKSVLIQTQSTRKVKKTITSTTASASDAMDQNINSFSDSYLPEYLSLPQDKFVLKLKPICPLEAIIPSPKLNFTRNKYEFSCGFNHKNQPCCGYSAGRTSKGIKAYEAPKMWFKSEFKEIIPFDEIPVPTFGRAEHPSALRLLHGFNDFLNQPDRQPVYSETLKKGFYRMLTIRINNNGYILIQVSTSWKSISLDEIDFFKEIRAFMEYFKSFCADSMNLSISTGSYGPVLPKPIIGISWATQDSLSINIDYSRQTPCLWKFGDKFDSTQYCPSKSSIVKLFTSNIPPPTFTESLLGNSFIVAPNSFFQVNTGSADLLIQSIAHFARVDQDAVVLDVCCGTGSIGISLLSMGCQQNVGIEIIQDAINDAIINAKVNNVNDKCTWICSPAKECIETVLKDLVAKQPKRIIAILDPPRPGCHKSTIKALRANEFIQEIIFVFCNPNVIPEQVTRLCKPTSKNFPGLPFEPVSAVALDLFPHTPHVETIIHLKRVSVKPDSSTDEESA